jgi:hypothetical protein
MGRDIEKVFKDLDHMQKLQYDYNMPAYLIESRTWLAASYAQAEIANNQFVSAYDILLCIDPPRCAFCATLPQAYDFFNRLGEYV